MRTTYSVWYIILMIVLFVCTLLAKRSARPTKNAVALLDSALMIPALGSLLLLLASDSGIARCGCYLYFLGMDLVLYALVNFTDQYCKGTGDGTHKPTVMYVALAADAVQLFVNLLTGHAFDVETVDIDDAVFYRPVAYFGLTLHHIVVYVVALCVILIMFLVAIQVPKISRERYSVLLTAMILVGLGQTYSIIFRSAIDNSMLGYGALGLVIYYFAIVYRPLRLLDRILSHIVSDLSDAFYIFDPNGKCIWANDMGCRLADIRDEKYETASTKLFELFRDAGDPSQRTAKRRVGEGADARFYILEENQVKDSRGNVDGTYLRIQDVTEGEHQLLARDEQIGQISEAAYRDALTGVGSKAAYLKKVTELNTEIASGTAHFAVAMVDMNNLKQINDDHGHKAGDIYIKGCCHLICEAFKHSPVFRIGGDEFVAVLQGQDYENRLQLAEQLRAAFAAAYAQEEAEPWQRYSAAVGMAENASDDSTFELVFKRADQAMYEEKKLFKKMHGSYR